MPAPIALADLTYERGKAVVLKGRADSNADIADAMRALGRMPLFRQALLDSAQARTDTVEPGYDFQITCPLATANDVTLPSSKTPRRSPAAKGAAPR